MLHEKLYEERLPHPLQSAYLSSVEADQVVHNCGWDAPDNVMQSISGLQVLWNKLQGVRIRSNSLWQNVPTNRFCHSLCPKP